MLNSYSPRASQWPVRSTRRPLSDPFVMHLAKRSSEIRVAVTGAGANGVFRWSEAEQALAKRFVPQSLEGLAASQEGLNSDIHADAEYRAHLIGVMARRAVAAATAR